MKRHLSQFIQFGIIFASVIIVAILALIFSFSQKQPSQLQQNPQVLVKPSLNQIQIQPQQEVLLNTGPYQNLIGVNVNNCAFYRESERPNEAVLFRSPKLLKYFQEASSTTGVPTAVLAGIARVESPPATVMSDEKIDAFCPISPQGAVGLMQIQPPEHIHNQLVAQGKVRPTFKQVGGYYREGVQLGTSFLGLQDARQLTLEDMCDPRKSLILAGGFTIRKTHLLTGNDTGIKGDVAKWNPMWATNRKDIHTVVTGYYGCLLYGDRRNPNNCEGQFNYGNDVWSSVSSCTWGSVTFECGYHNQFACDTPNAVPCYDGSVPVATGYGGYICCGEGEVFLNATCQANPFSQ